MNSFSFDKGVTIRPSATANLMVDSADRNEAIFPTPWDFQITKNQSIFNGFFSRIGVTEVVFDWCVDNVSAYFGNDTFSITDASGIVRNITPLDDKVRTVAQTLDALVEALNALGLPVYVFEVVTDNGVVGLGSGGVRDFTINASTLASQLNLPIGEASILQILGCPDLRPFKYLDVICDNLTYAQDLKDATTSTTDRDVLVRWYFSDDVPEQLDVYGFPILMGYTRFSRRRLYNPPKQIKWDNNLPVGNMRFQIYDQNGNLVTVADDDTQMRMTLQLSEN